jgi:hypothetical protein
VQIGAASTKDRFFILDRSCAAIMAIALDAESNSVVASADTSRGLRAYVNLTATFMVMAGLSIYVAARLYQQKYAWYAGTDSTNPLFDTYWMQLLWGEPITPSRAGGLKGNRQRRL